ncbi:MAG: bifunctional (p)ppGpp synthetase/guanosine-3',5'-bis(diphosphate) 3'-pyrophosphohydrolase [Acidimicrobiia bacterium]|nr:MAG: bifunctional (p)ppGpp synthetase/guanosine-3',5'-bis(diphosphate) 3'-pyrophosphohydrolase [Acidimicrobiia bacterium]
MADRPQDAVMAELAPVLDGFRTHFPHASDSVIHRAYERAAAAHAGQLRKSGEPYITHPLAVTQILAGYGLDAETLAASLLHDTVEDTGLTLDEIRTEFGDTVAGLIDGVTKLDRLRYSSTEEQHAATIRKMVIAMARDVRVLLIKLADRLHNVRTISPLSSEKQQRIATETLEVYAPLAHRLGVQEIKHEMEDRCFAILQPRRHAEVLELLRARAPERDAYLTAVIDEVQAMLGEAGIAAEVTGRPKHVYSIYRKMVDGGRTFDEIHDLIGIRIVAKEVADCYAALGIAHTRWPPVHGRFKDYIAMPKFNLYQSLHTTVLGPGGRPLEVQIRTREMHDRAEQGIAAHWRYKEGGATEEDLKITGDLAETADDYDSPSEFLAGLKLDLYQDEVFVLTPGGAVKTLPRGATPVDFAYSVHTEVGHRCTGARVNGRLVPLSTRLESGDIVEVITSKSDSPSRDWLGFVRTSRAAAKIRQWFSRERREQTLIEGREQVTRLLRREGLGLKAAERDRNLADVAESLGFRDMDSMFVAVGAGNVQPGTVISRLVRLVRPDLATEDDEDEAGLLPAAPHRVTTGGVVVEGMDDMLVRVANCCTPMPGDAIVGFVTVGRGVSIHRADCTNVGALGDRSERMIEVGWSAEESGTYRAAVQVEALDRPRLLRDVTTTLSDLGANIVSSFSGTNRDRVAILRFEIELSDVTTLDRALTEMKSVDGVYDAYRLLPGRTD